MALLPKAGIIKIENGNKTKKTGHKKTGRNDNTS
jgi:hypothetical protein